jgi:hypothetical protein
LQKEREEEKTKNNCHAQIISQNISKKSYLRLLKRKNIFQINMGENAHFFNISKSIDFQNLYKIDIFLDEDFEAPFYNGPPPFKEKKQQKKKSPKEKSKKDSPKSVKLIFTAEEDAMIIKFVENKGACCWKN